MGKHTLTKRQQLRIKKMQQQSSERAAKNCDEKSSFSNQEQEGIIIAQYRDHVEVADVNNITHYCYLRKNLGELAVGDVVIWQKNNKHDGVILATKPRHSELFRFHKKTRNKLVAANINQLFIVTAPEPPRALNVIDRYIMLAEIQGITPIIIYNKIDLVKNSELQTLRNYLSYYEELGYTVIYASTQTKKGISDIEKYLHNKASILVGLSGVGKSSIINSILPEAASVIGHLSEKSGEGNHTTTTAKLYFLPNDGKLIDCPGIRELAIGDVTAAQVLYGFKELRELAVNCGFRNCRHTQEINCAILQAEANSEVNLERLASYRNILEQLNLL